MGTSVVEVMTLKEQMTAVAKQVFGTTPRCRVGGYLLEDGKMLDFSSRKGEVRFFTHADIEAVVKRFEQEELVEELGEDLRDRSDAIALFQIVTNAIRMGCGIGYTLDFRGHSECYFDIQTRIRPTTAQMATIKECVCEKDATIVYDFSDPLQPYKSGSITRDEGDCEDRVRKFQRVINERQLF